MGATQGVGNVHVTVKVVAETVAGARDLVNTAAIAVLPGTFSVGPPAVVAGLVTNTRGRVTSVGVPTVVNAHAKGALIAKPLARLVTPLRVAVYTVDGAKMVPGVKVNVTIVCVVSRLSVPVALAHGAAQVRVILAVLASGESASFSVAEMEGVVTSTPAVASAGVSEVTTGMSAAVPSLPKI